ncbi:MAG TPA: SUMF1/EgtB/PvdO family nonheme iron enzyme [Polyangiaceae bacterium]|jgi:formylglycine-generating enzyme required for sulfatase activity
MNTELRTTADAYVGLDGATPERWTRWHEAMLAERERVLSTAGFDPSAYEDPATAWSDSTFRQLFLFLYDTSFYDPQARRYRTAEMVESWRARFGSVDEVLLWHAYPRLGFDRRTQFDFYRQMPGGLERLRRDVCDLLHAEGMRVFVDYNPWDHGSLDELAQVVDGLDADGVMLDTMTDVPDGLVRAVTARRRGVVFAPELRLKPSELRNARQSWAQWCDVGDDATPSVYRCRWLVPRHRQFAIARWDTSRRRDIVYSFFNGSGLVLWDNVFGAYNPYSRDDRRLIAETAAVFDGYGELFARGEWLPLVPTGVPGLDANRFVEASSGRAILTLRNRTTAPLAYVVPSDAPAGLAYFAFWGERREPSAGESVGVVPGGTQALVLDDPARARVALERFDELSRRADVEMPEDHERSPRPRALVPPRLAGARDDAGMVRLPGGTFDMRIRHARRECGCYPLGASDDAMWGWRHEDIIVHEVRVVVEPFAIRATAVTNDEFLAFVHSSGYRPTDGERFLAQLPRTADGALPLTLPDEQRRLPVTHVSLADARAFAVFHGQRLPSEAEWQWAAEGAGRGRRFPWGDDERRFAEMLRPAADEGTATPDGVMGLSGNAWELTESEHTDGHTRFVMLRGGVFLPPGGSEWLVARGPRPNDSHAKYLLLEDGLDRSEAISFRTVSPG